MLKTILTRTKLNEKAFSPKPIKDDLECCGEFWRKEYQAHDISHESEFEYIFSILFNAIEQLMLTEECVRNIINTLKNFKINCNTPPFTNHIEGIKKQLEKITFYFSSKSLSQQKISLALQLLDINVCAEGSFLKLQQLAYALSESSNIFSQLAELRLATCYRYYYTELSIQSIHNFASILNYAQNIGLNVLFEKDILTKDYIANDPYRLPFSAYEEEKFNAFFCRHYCVKGITQHITNLLENELKIHLHEFQKEVPDFGWVISAQIPTYSIEKKLNGLPIKKFHRLVEPISEDNDSYYRIKPNRELKKEVAWYLSKIGVFNKQSKKIKLDKITWRFTIIKGDDFGEYGYISNKVRPFPKKKFPLSTFEEKKLYEYFTLETFNSSKRFLILGQASFNYFYRQGANFNYCHLIDIDFRALSTDFFLLDGIKNAYLIRPQVTYRQFISFYTLKKHKAIQSNCIVDITNAKQFFSIITYILEGLESQCAFITRHKNILASEALHSEILQDLDKRNSALGVKLNGAKKELKNTKCNMKLISLTYKFLACYTLIVVIIILLGIIFPSPLLYIGFGLLMLDAFLIQISILIPDQIKLNQAYYNEQIIILEKEYNQFRALNKLIMKEIDFVVSDNVITEISCDLQNTTTNPTSISDYLLKGTVELPHKLVSPDNDLLDYRFRVPKLS